MAITACTRTFSRRIAQAATGTAAPAVLSLALCLGACAAPTTRPATLTADAPPPAPEAVRIATLPLPPTAPSQAAGACSPAVNPRSTGCISSDFDAIIEGPAYMWDARHVLLAIEFAGAPSSGRGSAFSGPQVIAIKVDGTTFSNGDAWKCITCGVPAGNRTGANQADKLPARLQMAGTQQNQAIRLLMDHPQAFPGDHKMIAGTNVVDCGPYALTDEACTPERVRIYPIRWNASADDSGPGGAMRELRLNPDGVHLMWSHMNSIGATIDQHGLVGKLAFNPSPKNGAPLVPRYELGDVTILTNTNDPTFAPFREDPNHPGMLLRNPAKGAIGEARGWTRDGKNALGMGMPDSGNVDMFITSLADGASYRLTSAPGYADPIMMSPDDKWFVVFDNRGVDRHMYYGAMEGIPPLTDMLTRMVMLSAEYGYRNGQRRFFQPYLIDRVGDRGAYQGQQLNAGPGLPGSASDPNWNARADPAWSPDGTNVVYWQALVTAPDCGGANPLPCPVSTEPGGRDARLMIAHLPSRAPLRVKQGVAAQTITVPWGTPYKPGEPMPQRYPEAPAGKFTMKGKVAGSAEVEIQRDDAGISYVAARYSGYSDDGLRVIDGTESAKRNGKGYSARIVWHCDVRASGKQVGTKKTSEPTGFVMSLMGEPLQGEIVTVIDGKTYRPPKRGT